jgi:hypothetical protein
VFREETELLRAGWLRHIRERGLTTKPAPARGSFSWNRMY